MKSVLSRNNRSAIVKFRCGVAPLRIETGRFESLPVDQRRNAFTVFGLVEDDLYAIEVCTLYQDLRDTLFDVATDLNADFDASSDTDKHCFIMSNKDLVYLTAKTCNEILPRGCNLIYN